MVATGALLWAIKERQRCAKALTQGRRHIGLHLVDGLNIGAIAGLPIAFAVYFWANRLLAPGLQARAALEIDSFFIAWGVAALLALLRPNRRMWQWQLLIGGSLFALLPVLNAITTGSHLGVALLQGKGPWVVVGFDLFSLGFGLTLLYAAKKLGVAQKRARVASPRKPKDQGEGQILQEAP